MKKFKPSSPIVQKQQHENSFGNNVGLKSNIKKSRTSFPDVGNGLSSSTMKVSVSEKNVDNMVVKAEQVGHESEDDDYQEYIEAETDNQFHEKTDQEHAEVEIKNAFTEAEMEDPLDEGAYQNPDETETSNLSTDSKGMFVLFC